MKRLFCILSLAFALALAYTGVISAQSWELGYVGDKIPDDPALDDDMWSVYKTDGIDSSDVCEITGAKELHMEDPADKVCFFMRELEDGTVGTVEAKVKVLEQSGATYTILMGIENDDRAWVDLFPDHIALEGGASYDVDMTQYHIVRITRQDAGLFVYVDGEEVLQGQVAATSTSRTCIIFGAGSTGGTGDHYWDYIAYTTAGAYSPDELEDYLTSLAVESEGKLAACWGSIKSR